MNGVLLTATVGYLTVAHQKTMKMYIYAIGVHIYASAVLLKDGNAKCGINSFFDDSQEVSRRTDLAAHNLLQVS